MYIKVIQTENYFVSIILRKLIVFIPSEDHTIVEPLVIPDGCKPGDRIFVEGNQGAPDDQLNPKKKVREIKSK